MHKKVKVVSDEKTKELLNSVSEEIQDVMKQFSNDEIKDTIESARHKQEQQIKDISDDIDNISEDMSNLNTKNTNTIHKKIVDEASKLSELTRSDIKINSDNIEELIKVILQNQVEQKRELYTRIDLITEVNSTDKGMILEKIISSYESNKKDLTEIQKTLNIVTENQLNIMEKILTMEKEQQKPWYKKLIKRS